MKEISEEAKATIKMYLDKGAEALAKILLDRKEEIDLDTATVETLMALYKKVFYAE